MVWTVCTTTYDLVLTNDGDLEMEGSVSSKNSLIVGI